MAGSSKNASAIQAVFIFMHGLGDQGASWEYPVRDLFKGQEFKGITWEFPDAPVARVTCNYGEQMPSWFNIIDIPVTPTSTQIVDKDLLQAIRRVHNKIDKYKESGVPASRIFLGGFSQGGALALGSTMMYSEPLGGTVVLSGWVSAYQPVSKTGKDTPILWCHGDADNVVEYDCARHGVPHLKDLKLTSVELKTYPGLGHSTCPQEMEDWKAWLRARLNSQPTTM